MLIWGLPSRQPNSLQIWGLLKVWLFQGPPDNSLPLTSFRHIRPSQTLKSKPVSHFNFTELTPIGYQTGHQLTFLREEHASYRIGNIRILIWSYCPQKSWVSSVFHVRRSIKRRASTLLDPTLATRPDPSGGRLFNDISNIIPKGFGFQVFSMWDDQTIIIKRCSGIPLWRPDQTRVENRRCFQHNVIKTSDELLQYPVLHFPFLGRIVLNSL